MTVVDFNEQAEANNNMTDQILIEDEENGGFQEFTMGPETQNLKTEYIRADGLT